MKKRILGRYDGKKRSWFRQFKEFLALLLLIVLLFQLVVGVFFVKGDSMYPTLDDGELALYLRIVQEYHRGDIVSVRLPSGEQYVKRIVGLPGDEVDFKDGRLLINGEPQDEPYANGESAPEGNNLTYPCTLTADPVLRPRRQPHPVHGLPHLRPGTEERAEREDGGASEDYPKGLKNIKIYQRQKTAWRLASVENFPPRRHVVFVRLSSLFLHFPHFCKVHTPIPSATIPFVELQDNKNRKQKERKTP